MSKQKHKEKEKEFEKEIENELENNKLEEIDENYLNELHEENEHECVVESLEIVKTHIYEKALRIGQKITYSDIFDFFFN